MNANIVYFWLLTFAALKDQVYISRCLQLAKLGEGYVAPNPMVGAVLVYDDIIIGEGYHQQYGGPHAEVNCINAVAEEHKKNIAESTLYVSLEPCAHFGKTPPCADLIIQQKIPRVVIACRDIFAKVNGQGIQKLKDAGIDVKEGILEDAAIELNKRFFCFHQYHRPYIILKWAQTSDGFIANENYQSIAISNSFSNRWVHSLRAQNAAIMIGTHTALYDEPSLTTRLWPGNNPVRIIIDKRLQIPATALLFNNNAPVIVFNEIKEEILGHIHFFKVDQKENLLLQMNRLLYQKNINSVLVEGGSRLLKSFADADLWDEAFCLTSSEIKTGSGIAAIQLPEGKKCDQFKISTDTISHYKNHRK